jgi:membrane-associated protein
MIELLVSAGEFLNPEAILKYGGLTLLLLIVFAETGLFFGFFLPGDSLLFTAGLLCGTELLNTTIITLLMTLCVAGIAGNYTGYIFGNKMGGILTGKKDGIFFKQKYLDTTKAFYEKHGGRAIILGRFFPIFRTFIPILAGVIKINMGRFMLFNIAGCVLWVGSLVLSGFFLGKVFPDLAHYIEYVALLLIVVTAIPVVVTFYRNKTVPSK